MDRARGEGSRAPCETGEVPDPLPSDPSCATATSGCRSTSEGEVHGLLRLRDVPEEEPWRARRLLAFLFGSLVGAHRLARLVRDAEFELKARLLELESLYDLGLSLGGQLDLSSLADEVLFRSISLTDAGRGTLVLAGGLGRRAARAQRGRRDPGRARRRRLEPSRGRAHQQRRGLGRRPPGLALTSCQKCLAVGDLGPRPAARRPRRRRQGVARRPRSRLHPDRRPPPLAVRQPGRRCDRDGASPQRRDREGAHRAGARARRGHPAPDPAARSARACRGSRSPRATSRPGRSAATTSTSSRSRGGRLGVPRRGRVRQGHPGGAARVDRARRGAPPDRRGADDRRARSRGSTGTSSATR